jgi:signal transduction histidine kinase
MTLEQISIFKKNVGKAPVSVLINLGLSYENQHLYAEAEKVYREAMDAARETDFISKMKISAGMHASLAGQKKYREAAPWADSIYTYAEKFTVHKSETKIREVVTAYEVEKKEAANQLLQREKQLIETRSQLYIGLGLTALIALLGVSFLVYRLRQNNAKLQAAYSEILQLNQARDYFFGVIAHDLRRPMSGFQDMAGLITYYLQQKRYGELDKISQSIEQMGQRIRLLLDNLLSWALSQREEVPYYPEKILFNEKIKQITGLYQQIAQYRNVQLIVECPKELTVYMDPNACELIIRNLIDNALKSARSGGQIRLIAKEDKEGYANVTVEDDGQGMAEEKLTMVRQILRQPELRADRPRGLGMILLGRFLKSNHIQVDINSTLGIGTRFLMNVPMA